MALNQLESNLLPENKLLKEPKNPADQLEK